MTASLAGRRALVLYGPTRAWIDPVRYLANVSSGKLGAALVGAAARRGAAVDAIVGAGAVLPPASPLVRVCPVETVADVLATAHGLVHPRPPDIIVMAMAVLDYQPSAPLTAKRSADEQPWTLMLTPTPKVIDQLRAWAPAAVLVGFKLESEPDLLHPHARQLLTRAGAQLVVANLTSEVGDDNHRAWIHARDGAVREAGPGKAAVAAAIVDAIQDWIGRQGKQP